MRKYILLLFAGIVLAACSRAPDPLADIADVSVPDQLTGCVTRADDGSCQKAVCVADDEDDCKAWVKACKKHDHIADVREGHDTCARAVASEESE